MHLAYVTASLPYGTGETFVVPEILELQKRGHRVTVVPLRSRGGVPHGDAGLLTATTVAEPLVSLTVLGQAFRQFANAPSRVFQILCFLAGSRNPAVFLKNMTVLPKGLWLAQLARDKRVDHIHAHFASTTASVALIASICSGVRWSFTAHRWDISENNLLERKLKTAFFARTIDERGAAEMGRLAPSGRGKIRVIHVGVSIPNAAVPAETTNPLRVLIGARIDDELKGHRDALEAIARLKAAGIEVTLDCAGDGVMRSTFESYASTLGVSDRVRFLGVVDHSDLLSRFAKGLWNAVLLPSLETEHHREGIPVFLIEAMAAGIPVVATSTGGIPELVGSAGLLVPQRDPLAIAEALGRLARDPHLRRRLASSGRRRVLAEFTVESTVSAFLDQIGRSRAVATERPIRRQGARPGN